MKKNIKKFIFKFLFGLEILIFSLTYLCGSNGIFSLSYLKKENLNLKNEIRNLQVEIQNLELKIRDWNLDSFNSEKVAREQLQLSKKGDQIYLIK